MTVEGPGPIFLNSAIRPLAFADAPWIAELVLECYPNREVKLGRDWMLAQIANRNGTAFAWRGEDSLIIAHVTRRYGIELIARVDMLCARRKKAAVLECLFLLKAAKRWAAVNGVRRPLILDADNGVDFGPFARRLGGCKVDPDLYPTYEIPLDGGAL